MRIGIIGDVHYGAAFSLGTKDIASGLNTRLVDYDNTLNFTIDSLADKGCRHLCFTGDIFEHRIPSVKQQELFSAALRRAIEKGFEHIHIVDGNHDMQRITGASTVSYLKELRLPNIHVYDNIDVFTVMEDGKPAANLILMPFRDRKWFNTDSNDLAVKQIDEILSYCLSSIENNATKILIGHMAIEGTMWMMDQYAELYNGNDLVLPVSMFNSIDITVMGHVHTPSLISKKPFVYYIGSMEKRGAYENHEKKYMMVDTQTKKAAVFSEPCRDIHDITINLSGDSHGESLMGHALDCVTDYAKQHKLEGAIVKVIISISAEDANFCDTAKIERALRETYKVYHCVEIKPSLIFSRQARDVRINENSSDPEAFSRFLKTTAKDSDLLDNIMAAGLEIISQHQGD